MSELEIWNELGNIYYNTGAFDESIRAYTKAIGLDQGSERSYSNLASIYVSQGRHQEAVSLLQKGIEHLEEITDKALLWNRLGEVYQKLDDSGNALIAYQKAVELNPDDTSFQDNLAKVAKDSTHIVPDNSVESSASLESDETSETEPNLTKTGAAPEASPTHSNLAESTPMELGGSPLSDELAENADKVKKDSSAGRSEMDKATKERAEALLQAGIQQWQKMDYERASRFLNMARDLATEFLDNRFEAACLDAIARVETDLGRYDIAIQAYESAASLDPGYMAPWNKLGTLYSQLDQYDKALNTFQKAIEYSPKNAVSWNGLGDVYHKLGRNEDAIAAYQLGNVFAKQGLDENIVPSRQVVPDAGQENVQIWKELGNIYYDAEAYEDAINAFTRAIKLLDEAVDKALLWGRLGDVYQLLDNQSEAIAAYRNAIELDPANAAFQDSLAKVESAAEHVDAGTETKNPEPVAESGPEILSSAEPIVEESNPSKPEEMHPAESESDSSLESKQTDDSGTDPEASPNSSNVAEDSESEATYWIFKPRKLAGSSSRSKVQPSIVVAEADSSSAKPLPAVAIPQFVNKSFTGNPIILDTPNETDVAVAEPLRKTEEANKLGKVNPVAAQRNQDNPSRETGPGISESSDTKPIKLSALGLQTAKAGNRTSNQFEKSLHSLENDIAAYRRVTEINPKNDRAWDALGNMYEAAGLHSEAIAAFEQAIFLDAKKEVYYYHLGLAHAAQTHYEKAIQALQNVVDLNPGYILAHCALAGYYRRIDKETEAQKHIAIARPIMENENEYNRACFESICGNADQALELLKTALDKQQIQLDWARNDPDLDFIRTDPRFETLLHKNGSH